MKKTIKYITLVFVLLVLICAGALGYVIYYPITTKSEAPKVDILVRWGASFGSVANQLYEKEVIRSIDQFKFAARLFDKTQKLRVGKFTLRKGMSNYAALKALVSGPQSYISIALPEGYDSRKFASIIQKHLEIDSSAIMALVTDSTFCKALGVPSRSLEGFLYPETYRFTYGIGAQQVLRTLVNQFHKMAPDSIFREAKQKGWTIVNVLTLASIIEGEAMVDEEMPLISSVYHNRLNRRMRLQADPTIQYIISDGPRRLLTKDLRIDSPYNTYLYAGLPPGPINNPGIKAIMAALHPADTDYLYFVANGDGTHSFSRTYSQHLRAKSRFDEVRRKVEQERRKRQNEQ